MGYSEGSFSRGQESVFSGPRSEISTPGAELSAGGSPASGTTELSHAGLSASVEYSGTDLSRAHNFFQPSDGGAASALNSLDISGFSGASQAAVAPVSGMEAAAMAPAAVPGDSGVLAAALTGGANEPISPLIQMIMRLPGAMGMVQSIFDFFAAFFNPMTFFDIFNPNVLAQHAQAVFALSAEHIPTSLALLPANAPIFGNLHGLAQPFFSSDLLSHKLNLSLGGSTSSTYGSMAHVDAFGKNAFNVSGEVNPYKALYEGAPGSQVGAHHGVAGPLNETSAAAGNHVAGNTRLFSDRMTSGGTFNSMNMASKTPGGTTMGGANLGQSGVPQGLSSAGITPPGSMLQPRFDGMMSQAAHLKSNLMPHSGQDVGYSLSGQNAGVAGGQEVGYNFSTPQVPNNMDANGVSYGPSGYVGSELGGTSSGNSMVAMDQSSFKPTLGSPEAQMRSAMPNAGQHATGASGQTGQVAGLKARQLSLDSVEIPKIKPVPTNQPAAGGTSHGAVAGDKLGAVKAPAGHHEAAVHPKVSHKVDHPTNHVRQINRVDRSAPDAVETADGNATAADGTAVDGTLADGTATDGTQLAANDGAAAQYTIQKGDCLWNIAKDHLGGGTKWQEIYDLNKDILGKNPDLIYPGTQINLPGADIASQGTTNLTNYVVKPGDNLWDISHDLLGKGSRWGELYQANQDLIGANPRLIHPGQELSIPSADPSGGAASGVSATNVDPNAVGTPGGTQPVAGDVSTPDMRLDGSADSVKSMQSAGTEYGASNDMNYQAAPPTQAPQAQAQPQEISSYPGGLEYQPAQGGFEPTVGNNGGLPVISANSQPIEAGPGAAMAATPADHAQLAANTNTTVSANNAGTAGNTTTNQSGGIASAATNFGFDLAQKTTVIASGFMTNLQNIFGGKK